MIGALMNQAMKIDGFLHGADPLSTMSSLNQIGAKITIGEDGLVYLNKRDLAFLDCKDSLDLGNSGTGLRLMLGLTAGIGLNLSFYWQVLLLKPKFKLLSLFKQEIIQREC